MAILEDFKFGAFSITAPKAAPQEIADYNERVLWLDVPQEQSLFFTPTEVQRYSKINKFLVKIKFSQTRVNSLFALKVLCSNGSNNCKIFSITLMLGSIKLP
jgi:hypothetical protein